MGAPQEDNDPRQLLKIVTYIFAGLSMMLNIRLCYSAAPYALLRFKLPENLFSIFVRKMASALELWCLPSMFLGNFIDLLDKYFIDEGHTQRQYTDAPKYDVNGDRLKLRAKALQAAARTLKNKAQSQFSATGDVRGTATQLATKAGEINQAATALSGPKLVTLLTQATELKNAAKGGTDSLFAKANLLAGAQNETNAIAVIDAFQMVKEKYEALSNDPKYIANKPGSGPPSRGSAQEKVQKVDEAWKQVKDEFEKLCIALIKHFTNEVENNARELASPSGGQTQADSVINEFDVVEKAYNKLPAGDKSKVKSEFDTVKHLYSRILNVSKANNLKDAATNLSGKANQLSTQAQSLEQALSGDLAAQKKVTKLKVAANELKQLLDGLSSANGADLVAKALAIRDKFAGFGPDSVKSTYDAVKDDEKAKGQKSQLEQVTSAFESLQTDFNKGQWNNISPIFDKPWIRWSSILWNWCNFFTFVILFFVFITGGDQGHVTIFYWVIAASGFVFGIYMVFVYAMEWWFLNWYMVGENSFPVVTSFMHYVSILIFGNRRKWNTDYIAVIIDMVISMCIAFIAAVLWTYCYYEPPPFDYTPPSSINPAIVSPVIMVLVGMAIVYAIYPAVAPGMIVPFYLIDKIEMVLLIMTCFPPVIVAVVCREKYFFSPKAMWASPSNTWGIPANNTFWHTFIFIPPLQICLTAVFLYSLHYRDSSIARSIINQPKMSTFLSIIFYMCHEIQLALGFPGMVGNNGGDVVMLPVQFAGALLMVFLAFYSEGYITEYKRHDPAHWPTEGDELKPYTYAFAGLAMMLNIRLVYSASPYALIRFKLPENLFSVFVRVMASSLELWCLPSMVIGNISELPQKEWFKTVTEIDDEQKKMLKKCLIIYPSIFWSWANFATFGILWIVYVMGGEAGNVTAFYWVIAASGFVFGINMVMVYAMEFWYLAYYMVGENSFPMVTSLMHYISTSIFGNRRKYDSDYIVVYVDIVISLAISFIAAVLWTYCYHDGNEGYPPSDKNQKDCKTFKVTPTPEGGVTSVTYSIGPNFDVFGAHIEAESPGKCNYKKFVYYLCLIPPCLMVLVGMGLVYAIYPGIAPGMIVPFYLIDKIEMVLLIATAFPPVIIAIVKHSYKGYDPYVLKGSWGVYHRKVCKSGNPGRSGCEEYTKTINSVKLAISKSDKLTHTITLNPGSGSSELTHKSDPITLGTSNGTLTINIPGGTITLKELTIGTSNQLTITKNKSKISVTKGDEKIKLQKTGGATLTGTTNSGTLSITKDTDGTGKEEVQISGTGQNVELNYSGGSGEITIEGTAISDLKLPFIDSDELHPNHESEKCCIWGKVYEWSNDANPYAVWWNIFNILMPLKISLAIIFIYSLHYRESSISRAIVNQPKMSTGLSIVFYMCHEILLAAGFPGIASDEEFLLPTQLIGAFLMVFLAFYSIGYITEYKRHDPSQWPTDGMTWSNSVCYWLKMASKITNKNLTLNFHLLRYHLYPLILEGLLFYNVLNTIYHIEIKHIIPHVIYNSI